MRERLAEILHETHCFTGRFVTYGKTNEGSNKACFTNICIGKQWITDHVWIHRSKQMKNLDLRPGDQVQFEARVGRYVKGAPRPHFEPLQYDYNLEKIRELTVIERSEGTANECEG